MSIKVKLIIYSALKNYVKNYNTKNGIEIISCKCKTIQQILQETINHPDAMDAISIVSINNQVIGFKDLNRPLKNGDVIKVYPPMGGG